MLISSRFLLIISTILLINIQPFFMSKALADDSLKKTKEKHLAVVLQYDNIVKEFKKYYPQLVADTKIVLEQNLDVNAKHKDNSNLLMILNINPTADTLELVKGLVKHGIDINHIDDRGNSALHYATRFLNKYSLPIIHYLLSQGAKPGIKNNKGYTPLAYAIMYGKQYALLLSRYFLHHGTNLKFSDPDGNTLLMLSMLAPDQYKYTLARELIRNGIDINAKNKFGNTFLMLSLQEQAPLHFVKYLIKHGADIHVKNKNDESILYLTLNQKKPIKSVTKYLISLNVPIDSKSRPLFFKHIHGEFGLML